jgi:transcriptional regulator with XRE-family HTH domain
MSEFLRKIGVRIMTTVEKIKTLCDEHGETFASLERKMDFGNGTIRRWATTPPSADRLAKVADFFNVSLDYLMGREACAVNNSDQLESVYFSFAKDAQDNGIDPRDIETILNILKKHKRERG